MGAPLTRLDPADDILAPHSFECIACGKAILDNQDWANFIQGALCVGRVHVACFLIHGPAKIAQEYENRIRDAAGLPRVTARIAPTVVH